MTFTFTIPMFVLVPLIVLLVVVLWFAAARLALAPILEKLARRNGNQLVESNWAWLYLVAGGPLVWIVNAINYKQLLSAQERGRKRKEARAANPNWNLA